jgi:uncharacterized membrane protein YqgA involved in biofilm formation
MMCQWFRIVQHLCRDAFILVTKSGYKLSFVLLTLLTWILGMFASMSCIPLFLYKLTFPISDILAWLVSGD